MSTRHDSAAAPDQFRQDGDGIGHAALAWVGSRWFPGRFRHWRNLCFKPLMDRSVALLLAMTTSITVSLTAFRLVK
jgi:hypothetical protein